MTGIISIETFAGHGCVVRVRTDDGLVRYGQAAHSEARITGEVLHTLVARHYLGADSFDVMTLADACARAAYKYFGSFQREAGAPRGWPDPPPAGLERS
ncbi:hypothetical protein ABZV93_17880 [Actinopolymorpha sp. NPDC004070]|uniref:hypothetical protein n=1 Tax=Actinopolymorpha sp. NPDC004070 TaxID=3154548 RepID=UPI0033B3C730